jgi:hypothetical protein
MGLYAGLEAHMNLSTGGVHHYHWKVDAETTLGGSVTLFTSAALTTSDWTRYEEHITPATIAAAGIGTPGDYYRIWLSLWIETAGDNVYGRRYSVNREPVAAPAGDWPTLTEWAHGDADVGAARLNAICDGLDSANTGLEIAYHEIPIQGGAKHVGVHILPWLIYNPTVGVAPTVRYGAHYAGSYSLPSGTGHVSFDLRGISGLTIGSRYLLEGCNYAIEKDSAYA